MIRFRHFVAITKKSYNEAFFSIHCCESEAFASDSQECIEKMIFESLNKGLLMKSDLFLESPVSLTLSKLSRRYHLDSTLSIIRGCIANKHQRLAIINVEMSGPVKWSERLAGVGKKNKVHLFENVHIVICT